MTTKNKAAQSLRSIPSAIRSDASRANGAKGGRPRNFIVGDKVANGAPGSLGRTTGIVISADDTVWVEWVGGGKGAYYQLSHRTAGGFSVAGHGTKIQHA